MFREDTKHGGLQLVYLFLYLGQKKILKYFVFLSAGVVKYKIASFLAKTNKKPSVQECDSFTEKIEGKERCHENIKLAT